MDAINFIKQTHKPFIGTIDKSVCDEEGHNYYYYHSMLYFNNIEEKNKTDIEPSMQRHPIINNEKKELLIFFNGMKECDFYVKYFEGVNDIHLIGWITDKNHFDVYFDERYKKLNQIFFSKRNLTIHINDDLSVNNIHSYYIDANIITNQKYFKQEYRLHHFGCDYFWYFYETILNEKNDEYNRKSFYTNDKDEFVERVINKVGKQSMYYMLNGNNDEDAIIE